MGRFITFEGIEGCGKTTQIRMAGEFLSAQGIPVIVTEEPGGTILGAELRRILLNRSTFDLCKEAELFLFLADRAQHVKETNPAGAEGRQVGGSAIAFPTPRSPIRALGGGWTLILSGGCVISLRAH